MRLNFLPTAGDIFFVFILILFLFQLPNFFFTDGSLGWHLATGNYILSQHHLPATDLFSFTFPNKNWIAYEWLFDLTAALLFKAGGLPLLAVLAAAWIGSIYLCLYGICRQRGCHFTLVLGLLTLGLLASSIHFLARPHLMVHMGVLLYTWALTSFLRQEVSSKTLLITLPLFMLFWVNTHPGFLIGLATVAIVLLTNALLIFIGSPAEKQLRQQQCKVLALTLLFAGTATFCNPYGFSLFGYILHYLSQTAILAETNEYASPVFHGQFPFICLELLYGILLLALYLARKKPPLPELALVAAFAHLSLSSVRNIPLFVIASLPFIASCFAESVFSPANQPQTEPNKWLPAKWFSLEKTVKENEAGKLLHLIPILCVIILSLSCLRNGHFFGINIICSTFDPQKFPTQTLLCMQNMNLPEKEGLIVDNWGGYVNFLTGYKLFIDDRSDFYGQDFCLQYGHMVMLYPGWEKLLERNQISWILFPANSRLALELKNHDDWQILCTDAASLLIQKKQTKQTPL